MSQSPIPARPTVATPATLTPVGYLQFETGFLAAWHSPEVSYQGSFNEVMKFSVSRWIELLVEAEPYAHSHAEGGPANATRRRGSRESRELSIMGEGARPTIALSYFGRVYSGDAPDLDIGSFTNSVLLLASADVKGFHYDTNYFFNEVVEGAVRRAQFGQTLSVSHPSEGSLGSAGEIWHFTQPFLRGNTVGKSVGGELQRAKESGARLRFQSRTHQHVHPLGGVCRIHLPAAAQAASALKGRLVATGRRERREREEGRGRGGGRKRGGRE